MQVMTVVVMVRIDGDPFGRQGTEQREILRMRADGLRLAGAADVPVEADDAIGGRQTAATVTWADWPSTDRAATSRT